MNVELKKNEPFLQNISFEVKAGELLAVMATTGSYEEAVILCPKGPDFGKGQSCFIFQLFFCS